jgi:hypothetical protein
MPVSRLESDMIWAKRQFKNADYLPYFKNFETLLLANAPLYREFLMVSVKVKAATDEIYIGLPSEVFLQSFDGFERVDETAVPKLVDTLLIGDQNVFRSRFEWKHNQK